MKKKIIGLFILLALFSGFVRAQTSQTIKYFSFDYQTGEKESDFSMGTFQKLRFGLIFLGAINPKVSYTLELAQWETDKIELKQAWAGLLFSEAVNIKLGMFLVPFGRYNQINRGHETKLVQPPLNVEYLYPFGWNEMGVQIDGSIGGLIYSAYLGNGLREAEFLNQSQQLYDNNSNKARGFRLGWRIGGGFEIGYSNYNGKYDDNNRRSLGMQGADLIWVTENSTVMAEYTRANIETPVGFDSGEAEGYFILLSFPLFGVYPVISYQSLDYQDPYHGPGFRESGFPGSGILEQMNRWTFGLIYNAYQNLVLKVQYDLNQEKDISLKNNLFIFQVALSF